MITSAQPEIVDQDAKIAMLVEKARTSFLAYVRLCNPPSSGFVLSILHRHLISMVQKVADNYELPEERRKTRPKLMESALHVLFRLRQIVSVPPQHGKSKILSVEAPAWLMGRKPGINVAITGYSQDLTIGFAKQVRNRLTTPIHMAVFPKAVPIEGSNRADAFECENESSLRAKSTGAKLTGRRVDYLVVDDPHSGREEAESPTQRKKVVEWYYADCYTRLSPGAVVFIIATRWHPEDLIGELTKEEKVKELTMLGNEEEIFQLTNLPALAEPNDPLGRKEGEALFPEIRHKQFLMATKANLPAYEWDSQYQGHPKTAGGEQADIGKIIKIPVEQVPWRRLEICRGWDLALSEEETADFTAGALAGWDWMEEKLYIIDMFRNRGTWVKNKKNMLRISKQEGKLEGEISSIWPNKVMRVGIEAVAGFAVAYAEIREALLGEIRVEARNPARWR